MHVTIPTHSEYTREKVDIADVRAVSSGLRAKNWKELRATYLEPNAIRRVYDAKSLHLGQSLLLSLWKTWSSIK